MKISVIICTYTEKRWDTLVAAITSVQQQSMSPQEIIVVSDNNPALAVRVRAQLPSGSQRLNFHFNLFAPNFGTTQYKVML